MIAGETFVELLKSPGHWYFEIFLMVLFDFVIGVLLWQKLIKPHIHRDVKHAGHAHGPHEAHVDSKEFKSLQKAVNVAVYHLDQDDPESAWKVLVDLADEE